MIYPLQNIFINLSRALLYLFFIKILKPVKDLWYRLFTRFLILLFMLLIGINLLKSLLIINLFNKGFPIDEIMNTKELFITTITGSLIFLGINFIILSLVNGKLINRLQGEKDDRHLLFQRMKSIAETDTLTGVYSKRSMETIIEESINQSMNSSTPEPFGLIMVDLDHFKLVNATFGHEQGDVVLRNVIQAIQLLIRDSDSMGRWGGDRFIINLSQSYIHAIRHVSFRVLEHMRNLSAGSKQIPTVSLGYTEFNRNENQSALIQRVTELLEEAKRSGRDSALGS